MAVETELGLPETWHDDHPYYLLIVLAAGHALIDLGEPGWLTKYADYFRVKAKWCLVRKADHVVLLMMNVIDGEQPYYVARHVGFTEPEGSREGEMVAYGIGKKRLDGHVDRLWVMENGVVTLGDDLEPLALDILKSAV